MKKFLLNKATKLHYVSVEGSMCLTREERWKEIKLGRVFRQQDIVQTSETRTALYTSHFYKYHISGLTFNAKLKKLQQH